MSKLKLGLDAGHGLPTPARRVWKKYDKNQTQEWQLNERICRYIEEGLKDYKDVTIIRLDDRTGKRDVPLVSRTNKANREKVDIVLSIHADAGINGGEGGGITTFIQPTAPAITRRYQREIYNVLIKHTRLKGNRASPIATKNLHMTRETKMPTVLIEHGFMDSSTDAQIIITDGFARQCANAYVEFLVKEFKLKRKSGSKPSTSSKPKPSKTGKPKLIVDGYWGNKTTTKAQQVFNTIVDGVISGQYRTATTTAKYMTGKITFEQTGRSQLIKAIQKWVGVSVDGLLGVATVRGMQKKLNVAVDGIIGPVTIRAFQSWLNSQ